MDDNLTNFMAITGADANAAQFYVEAAGGNVELAVANFFDGGGGGGGGFGGGGFGGGGGSGAVFGCHQMNRDVWADETVQAVVEASFVLWLRPHTDPAAVTYADRYDKDRAIPSVLEPPGAAAPAATRRRRRRRARSGPTPSTRTSPSSTRARAGASGCARASSTATGSSSSSAASSSARDLEAQPVAPVDPSRRSPPLAPAPPPAPPPPFAGGAVLGGGAGSAFAAPPPAARARALRGAPGAPPAAPAGPAPWADAVLSPEPAAGGVMVQFRLPNGAKKRRFEPSDTVAALFKFAAEASQTTGLFDLRCGFPPRQLWPQKDLTLEEAKVHGEAIQMKQG
ncbi:hypothetical protein SO694_00189036 [Aureococcus anophagefferens]|uniref:UBX domain-containing protein n=1 Tax=Aureococcus anophagefferens TaxID=44056 RepID=A0ABR1FGK3_AURAN